MVFPARKCVYILAGKPSTETSWLLSQLISFQDVTTTSLRVEGWGPASYQTDPTLNHLIFEIPEPDHFYKSVLRELDATLATLDSKLTTSVSEVNADINTIDAGKSLSSPDYVAYVVFSFSVISCTSWLIVYCIYRKHGFQHPSQHNRYSYGKLRTATSVRDQTPPVMVEEEHLHNENLERGSHGE